MILVLRKVAQLNIKYRKKWETPLPRIYVCTGAPPDEVTDLLCSKFCCFFCVIASVHYLYKTKMLPVKHFFQMMTVLAAASCIAVKGIIFSFIFTKSINNASFPTKVL